MTTAEYNMLLDREVGRRCRANGCAGGQIVEVESELHSTLYDECRRRGWIALHGSMAERTHRTLGEFDFVILADGGRVFLVECKSRTGKLTPAQAAMHHHAARLGHKPVVVRSLAEFLSVIEPQQPSDELATQP